VPIFQDKGKVKILEAGGFTLVSILLNIAYSVQWTIAWSTEKPNKETILRQMIGAMLLLMFVVTGCASTQEAKSVGKSGFLEDYSILKEGERSTIMGVAG
jgi:hypothetical protein